MQLREADEASLVATASSIISPVCCFKNNTDLFFKGPGSAPCHSVAYVAAESLKDETEYFRLCNLHPNRDVNHNLDQLRWDFYVLWTFKTLICFSWTHYIFLGSAVFYPCKQICICFSIVCIYAVQAKSKEHPQCEKTLNNYRIYPQIFPIILLIHYAML